MEEVKQYQDGLENLARLGLAGRVQDIQRYIHRLANSLRKEDPNMSERLFEVIRENPTIHSPFRSQESTAIPTDRDSRLRLLRVENPVTLDIEPVLTESLQDNFNQLLSERKQSDALMNEGFEPIKSALFFGSPGTGKTLSARWIARELDLPLLILDLSAVMSSFLGRTGINVRHVLDYAKSIECVFLLDELDALAKRRDDATEVGELKRLVTVLLQEIDDWPSTGLLLATTNHPKLLDPAVWRRFEMLVEFPMPNREQIEQAVRKFLGGRELNHSLFDALCIVFEGQSFSDIETHMKTCRKRALLNRMNLDDCLLSYVRDRIDRKPPKTRLETAVNLVSGGLSQRKASEITGVHRDTIRKALGNQN